MLIVYNDNYIHTKYVFYLFTFRLTDADVEDIEAIVKENILLKQQLHSCYMKVSKTQKVVLI